ncbi:phosphoenolpyruvate-protein phosphotransferase [Spirochaetia bacterium]|nr:phosphoenolpyruvate-protein phosphotransferase [Spirochaetia bacterium]
MKRLSGIPASSGISAGIACLYQSKSVPEISRLHIPESQCECEELRFTAAVSEASREIQALCEQSDPSAGDSTAIFQAHLMMIEDPEFHRQIRNHIHREHANAEWALWECSAELAHKLEISPEPYLRERAADINDVTHRILNCLSPAYAAPEHLEENTILIVHDLLPSELLALDRTKLKGIVSDAGGATSHTAILASAFGIPAVVGLHTAMQEINSGELVVVDGDSGQVIVGADAFDHYRTSILKRHKEDWESLRDLPAQTLDGHRVLLKANIGNPAEAEHVLQYGAEGVGLFRSEFLFLRTEHRLTEEDQYRDYRQVIDALGERPVTIRTIDCGGDKILHSIQLDDEKNPLLGWRAIRIMLARPDFFKTQIRAILRAAAGKTVEILFPLISGVEELIQAREFVEEAKQECREKKLPFAENISIGSMIEVPAAAVTADILAEYSDFLSIGTNDLVQYTLAVDRNNEKVNYLAQPFHPAIIRLIKRTIDAAHHAGIKVTLCGELAGNPSAAKLLIGLDLDVFSMRAQSIPTIKQIIRQTTLEECHHLAKQVLSSTTIQQVIALVEAGAGKP